MFYRADRISVLVGPAFIVLFGACSTPIVEEVANVAAPISSTAAQILDFGFEAQVVAAASTEARKAIVSQLMYTQGILMSAGNGNAQIGNVQLEGIVESPAGDSKRITYRAALPVAWPKDVTPPSSYELVLPLDVTRLSSFNATYDGRCGKAGHGQDAFWFDWNPKADRCNVEVTDVTKASVSVSPSARRTDGRYPEYDLIWSDDRLDVTALFSVIVDGGARDLGFINARSFIDGAKRQLGRAETNRNETSSSVLEDTTITGKVSIGGRERDVKLDVLVVPKLTEAGPDFEARYGPLSERADLLLYNGHAGLGAEINAFGRAGKVATAKYQLALLNGCQTFAYIDTTMTDRRRAANGSSDPNGTRYLDVVANALTSRTESFVETSDVLIDAVLHSDTPRSYSDLLRGMPDRQIPVVFGEEDNHFSP